MLQKDHANRMVSEDNERKRTVHKSAAKNKTISGSDTLQLFGDNVE